jgi:transposase
MTDAVQQERQDFVAAIAVVPTEHLVFLDEAGSNRAMTPAHAWAPAGQRAVAQKPCNHGKNITMLGAVRVDGPVALRSYVGAMDTNRFEHWLRRVLGPRLKPGDVVVMDNLRAHHGACVTQIIESFGACVLYLPPYSPDLNPIEMVWSVMKHKLRRAGARSVARLKRTIAGIWSGFRRRHFAPLYAACGYA